MAITPNMSLSLPTPGPGGTAGPTWASDLNTAFGLVDEHDHSTGKGVQIRPPGININADFTFNSHNALALTSTRYDSQASALIGTLDKRCVYSVNGEMYYNDASGNAIQLTSGGAINIGSLGAIGGMGGTTAAVTFSDVNKTFAFTQAGGITAKLITGDILLYENIAGAQPITIKSPASLVGAYTITFPAAVPADTKIMTMTSSGTVVLANNGMVPIGTIIPFYDYNAALTFDSSYWAYCDGSTKTVGGSSRVLPDMSNRYLVGFGTEAAGDMDTAAWATAAVGYASHTSDHTHAPGTLQFKVSSYNFGSSYSVTMYESDGTPLTVFERLASGGATGSSDEHVIKNLGASKTFWTLTSASTGLTAANATAGNIQPRSIRVRFIMRTA